MDSDLTSYLAAQNAAAFPPDEEDPQPDADPSPTDGDFGEEAAEDGAPGTPRDADDADLDDDDEEEESEAEGAPGVPPELMERIAALERERDDARGVANQVRVQAEFDRLQARWRDMDPEDAQNERFAVIQHLSQQQQGQLLHRAETAEQQLDRLVDLRENQPRAVAYLAKLHELSPSQVAHLRTIDDALTMKAVAEGFAADRKAAAKAARRAEKARRQREGADPSGGPNRGAAPTQPASTGSELFDYLRQQSAQMAAPRPARTATR